MSENRSIGVLAGGDSPEREVSRVSGQHVLGGLLNRGHNAHLLTIASLDDLFPSVTGADLVFNCLHGGAGEDGTVQLFLDVIGIPYTGSGAQACARAMDKARAKSIFEAKRLPTPPGALVADIAEVKSIAARIPPPYVVKPVSLGSSLHVSIAESMSDLTKATHGLLEAHGGALIESFIDGRELTVGVLRMEGRPVALPIVEIRFPTPLFDYQAKYDEGISEFIAPADLPDPLAAQIRDLALRAHLEIGCYGYSRVDFRLSRHDQPYILEVNTLPGMTPMSDLPRSAAAAGIGFEDLVERMLASAHKEDQ